MKTETFEYDMYHRYIVCGKCGKCEDNYHDDEVEGDTIKCNHCNQESVIGQEYSTAIKED